MKDSNVWFRISYSNSYQKPITGFKIAQCDYESPDYLLLPKKYKDENYKPIRVTKIKDNDESYLPILQEVEKMIEYNDYYVKIPSSCNVKDYCNLLVKSDAAVLLVSRSYKNLPLREIQITPKPEKKTVQFGVMLHKSPYIYKYLPEIIDNYPIDQSLNPGTAVLCFPDGVHIDNKYNLPSWFNFIMTDETGNRTYGSCLTFWEELTNDLIESFIPIYYDDKNKYYVEKGICLISYYPFYYNCRNFLKQLYRIQVSSSTNIPLERAICCFVDQLIFQNYDKILTFNIAEEQLKFYCVPIYGSEWDTNDECIETLFSVLGFFQIITVWQGLLLDKHVFLLCTSKTTLSQLCSAFMQLLFPFQWYFNVIPILPEKLKDFIGSPNPIFVGINFPVDLKDFPNDALILNVDKNCFENYVEKIPRLPNKLFNLLSKKLNKIKDKYKLDNPVNASRRMKYIEKVYPDEEDNNIKINVSEIRDIFYDIFIHMFKNYEKYFDWKNKNKKKKQDNKEKKKDEEEDEKVEFLPTVFLKDHSSLDPDSFLSKFIETTTFAAFKDSFQSIEQNSIISFFLDCIKNGRRKSKVYLPEKIPSITTMCPEIKIDDLKGESFFYANFPKLNPKYYIKTDIPKTVFKSRFFYTRDEWCYDYMKLNNKEWGNFLLYTIYEIWFNFFTFSLRFYDDNTAIKLMEYAIVIIEDLIVKKKITPSKNLLTKLVKSCARTALSHFVKSLLELVNSISKKPNSNALFYNAFMNGIYSMTEDINNNNFSNLNNSTFNMSTLNQFLISETRDGRIVEELISKTIFLPYEYCPYCLKFKKTPKRIKIEEILAGFSRGKSDYGSICPSCLNKIFPKLYFVKEDQDNLESDTATFLSPLVLVKEVDNLIKNHKEFYFYQEAFYKDKYQRSIFWNLVFYFELIDLPLCVLYLEKRPEKLQELYNFLNESSQRRIIKKKQTTLKPNYSFEKLNNLQNDNILKKNSSTSNDLGTLSIKSGQSNLSKYDGELWNKIKIRLEKNFQNLVNNNSKNGTEDRRDINARIYEMKQVMDKVILYFENNTKERITKFLNGIENKENSKFNNSIEKETEIFSNTSNISMNKIENKLSIKNSISENKNDEVSDYTTPDKRAFNILNKPFNLNVDKDNISDFNIYSKDKNENLNEQQLIKTEKSDNHFDDTKSFPINKNENNIYDKKNDTMSNFSDPRKTLPVRSKTSFNLDKNSNKNEVKPLLSTKPFLLQGSDNKKNNPNDIFHIKPKMTKIVLNKK